MSASDLFLFIFGIAFLIWFFVFMIKSICDLLRGKFKESPPKGSGAIYDRGKPSTNTHRENWRKGYSPYNTDYQKPTYRPRVIHHEPHYTMFTGDTSGMNGFEFEKYCADLLKNTNQFAKVEVTQKTGDYGADIVATDRKGHRWVWQCKSYKSKLGNSPIQEVVTAKAHYRADVAGVITNSTFTDAARKLADENGVVLIDKNGIPTVGNRRYSYSGGPLTYGEMMFYDLINGD